MSDMLKSYRFREERESDWRKLDRILTRAENSGVKALSDEDMMALPHLYRQAVSSLSVARSISLDQNVITYLEGLCTRAYFYVYGARTSMGERMAQFIRIDWPEAVRGAVFSTILAACSCSAARHSPSSSAFRTWTGTGPSTARLSARSVRRMPAWMNCCPPSTPNPVTSGRTG